MENWPRCDLILLKKVRYTEAEKIYLRELIFEETYFLTLNYAEILRQWRQRIKR